MRKLTFVLFFLCSCAAAQDSYEIFSLDTINVKPAENVVVYNLTAGDQWMAQLNETLKQRKVMNEQDAAQFVTQEFKQTLSHQAAGLAKAAKYKLKYFPAVVLNEQAVLYGTTDINQVKRYASQ